MWQEFTSNALVPSIGIGLLSHYVNRLPNTFDALHNITTF